MPRVVGVDIPDNKRLEISLTYIHGIGRYSSNEIIGKLKLNKDMRAKELSQEQVAELNKLIEDAYIVEGNRRRLVQNNIKRLIDIGTWRGSRHKKGLPVRGQGTQKNARTRKGRKKTVAGRKK